MKIGKPWEELQIRDDFHFAKVMRDKEICKKLLEKLLQTKITDIIYLEEEKVIDIKWDAKSIRLDVYVEDGNRVFNLEMQTTNQKNLPKRSRYYGSMIDLNTIEKGESYKKPFVQEMETKVEEVKSDEKWRQEYMTLLMREEEIREESLEKGLQEGIQGTVRILKSINISEEEIKTRIMQTFQLSEEEAESYLNNSR